MQLNFVGATEGHSGGGVYLLDLDGQLKLMSPPADSKLNLVNKSDLSPKFETKFVVNLAKLDINPILENLLAHPW